MSCGSCNTKSGNPKGCKNNGIWGTDGYNKLNIFDWLTNKDPITNSSQNIFKVRLKKDRKSKKQVKKWNFEIFGNPKFLIKFGGNKKSNFLIKFCFRFFNQILNFLVPPNFIKNLAKNIF